MDPGDEFASNRTILQEPPQLTGTERLEGATDDREPFQTRRRAALALAVAGAAIGLSSTWTWDSCFNGPCAGGLFGFTERTGVAAGPGILTCVLGLLLLVIGIGAHRRDGRSPFRIDAIAASVGTLIALGAYATGTFLIDDSGRDIGIGLLIVGPAAVVGAAASVRLLPADAAAQAWARARRPTVGLVLAALVVWGFAAAGQLELDLEAYTISLVGTALGIGRWPAPLPGSRTSARSAAGFLLGYGVMALAITAVGRLGGELLAVAPLVVVIALVVNALAELPAPSAGVDPAATTPARPSRSFLSRLGSPAAQFGLALLLTGIACLIVLARIRTGNIVVEWSRAAPTGAVPGIGIPEIAVLWLVFAAVAIAFIRTLLETKVEPDEPRQDPTA